jgi:hypothetical protein
VGEQAEIAFVRWVQPRSKAKPIFSKAAHYAALPVRH